MNVIGKLEDLIVLVAKWGTGLSFSVLIAAVLLQVFARLSGFAFVWTEELTRYALLFSIAFGAGLAFRSGDLVNVDVVCEFLPGRLPWILRLFSAAATAALSAFLLSHAWRYVAIGKMQTSPALGVRMDFIHFTVWLLLLTLTIFSSLRVVSMLAKLDDGKPKKEEEA